MPRSRGPEFSMSTDIPTPTPEPHIPPESGSDVPERDETELGDDEDVPSDVEPGSDADRIETASHFGQDRPDDWGWHQQDEQS